ncbi:MAG TPA: hypothetical protein VFL14_10960 [Xanthomonadales bacterium]|nr:hypothetical protein [Xanthomonadales bacterium]
MQDNEVEIAITHPRPTATRPRAAHRASMHEVLDAWQVAFEGRSYEISASVGNSFAARLALPTDDDPALALRELDASLWGADLARTMTDHARDRTRGTTAIATRLQWRDWITRELSPRRRR